MARHVHEHVLHAAASLPPGALQPGDVNAATEVRAGLLNADVTPAADAAARCIQHTVDDLGLPQPDLLDELAAQAIADELAERTPCRWGRHHTDAVRAALYRILADLAPPPAEGGLRGRVVLTF